MRLSLNLRKKIGNLSWGLTLCSRRKRLSKRSERKESNLSIIQLMMHQQEETILINLLWLLRFKVKWCSNRKQLEDHHNALVKVQVFLILHLMHLNTQYSNKSKRINNIELPILVANLNNCLTQIYFLRMIKLINSIVVIKNSWFNHMSQLTSI